jgi:hypothetical protein
MTFSLAPEVAFGPAVQHRRATQERRVRRVDVPVREPTVAFVVMSATQPASVVTQLVDALAPHRVLVHHDFTKQPGFRIDRPNASLVPAPRVTGWGTWGFCDALLHSLEHCVREVAFDYCQVLSPTCLPVRPVADFVRHLVADPADAHADLVDLDADVDVWMTYAYRAFFDENSLRARVLARLRRVYFGAGALREHAGSLEILRSGRDRETASAAAAQALAVATTRLVASLPGGASRYASDLKPVVGSTWFGVRRDACVRLLEAARRPDVASAFRRTANADEHVFPTLLRAAAVRPNGSNHFISPFDLDGHPIRIGLEQLDRAAASGRFFARKFADDPADPVRRRALAMARG